ARDSVPVDADQATMVTTIGRLIEELDAFLIPLTFFFQAEDGIRDRNVTGVQTCALPISFDPTRDVRTVPSEPTGGRLAVRIWSEVEGASVVTGRRTTMESHRAVRPRSIRSACWTSFLAVRTRSDPSVRLV